MTECDNSRFHVALCGQMATTPPTAGNVHCRCWRLALLIAFSPLGCGSQEAKEKQMSRSPKQESEETLRFHQVVETGNFEELQLALKTGSPVNAPGHNGVTALMLAIASKDLEKMKLLTSHGA